MSSLQEVYLPIWLHELNDANLLLKLKQELFNGLLQFFKNVYHGENKLIFSWRTISFMKLHR